MSYVKHFNINVKLAIQQILDPYIIKDLIGIIAEYCHESILYQFINEGNDEDNVHWIGEYTFGRVYCGRVQMHIFQQYAILKHSNENCDGDYNVSTTEFEFLQKRWEHVACTRFIDECIQRGLDFNERSEYLYGQQMRDLPNQVGFSKMEAFRTFGFVALDDALGTFEFVDLKEKTSLRIFACKLTHIHGASSDSDDDRFHNINDECKLYTNDPDIWKKIKNEMECVKLIADRYYMEFADD